MIFVFIASTYTPVVATSLDGGWSTFLLAGAWIGAVVGVGVSLFGRTCRWVTSGAYLVVGWLAVAGMPALWSALEHWQFGLLARARCSHWWWSTPAVDRSWPPSSATTRF